jgi:hypothetical protein
MNRAMLISAYLKEPAYWRWSAELVTRWVELVLLAVGTYHCIRYVIVFGRYLMRKSCHRPVVGQFGNPGRLR